ncbi:MAG: hypothetical protein HY063_14825 [Bacteroidetes bacterium]|nr:hypothetical protein [Bacteroidota bacterium]
MDSPFETIWVKSYSEFVEWITSNGLPSAICFDHDLGERRDAIKYEKMCSEKTGYDCAKWLVEYCLDNNIKEIPKWNIQSANPVGKENINGLLLSFLKNTGG